MGAVRRAGSKGVPGGAAAFHRPRGETSVPRRRRFVAPAPARDDGLDGHWQASQASGFSSEHATAACGEMTLTVALAMRVAGRERR